MQGRNFMPNPPGEKYFDRERAPQMYIMTKEGNPNNDGNYTYVGNASAYFYENGKNGLPAVTFHLGATALLGSLVCDQTIGSRDSQNRQPVPTEAIPPQVKEAAIKAAIRKLPQEESFSLLTALGATLPPNVDPSSAEVLFTSLRSETSDAVAEVKKQSEYWLNIKKRMLDELGLSNK
jgi:hypothetical protein